MSCVSSGGGSDPKGGDALERPQARVSCRAGQKGTQVPTQGTLGGRGQCVVSGCQPRPWLGHDLGTKGHTEGPAVEKTGTVQPSSLKPGPRSAPASTLHGAQHGPPPHREASGEASSGPAAPCPGLKPRPARSPALGEPSCVKCPWLPPPACSAHRILRNVLCPDPFQQPQIFLVSGERGRSGYLTIFGILSFGGLQTFLGGKKNVSWGEAPVKD